MHPGRHLVLIAGHLVKGPGNSTKIIICYNRIFYSSHYYSVIAILETPSPANIFVSVTWVAKMPINICDQIWSELSILVTFLLLNCTFSRLCYCRSRWIWCWYRNSFWFSRWRIRQESLFEDAALLLLCSWVCSLWSNGPFLPHDCVYDPFRSINEQVDNLLNRFLRSGLFCNWNHSKDDRILVYIMCNIIYDSVILLHASAELSLAFWIWINNVFHCLWLWYIHDN